MHYIIYKITNQINGKIYIGAHKTNNLNDNYMGSGILLQRAIKKHGIENFKKEILHQYDNSKEMFAKEAEIVNEDFLKENHSYNLKNGGSGGFDYINKNPDKFLTEKRLASLLSQKEALDRWKHKYETSEEFREKIANNCRIAKKKAMQNNPNGTFYNKKHKEETKIKIGIANSKHQTGSGNSQYGKIWIYNNELQQNIRIDKNDKIPPGWERGRKMKW